MRDPRDEDHTTRTAVAPKAIFTVRTYAVTPHRLKQAPD